MLRFENGLILDGDSEMELGTLKHDGEQVKISIDQIISHGDLLDLIDELKRIEEELS
jgi:hypothetical protein